MSVKKTVGVGFSRNEVLGILSGRKTQLIRPIKSPFSQNEGPFRLGTSPKGAVCLDLNDGGVDAQGKHKMFKCPFGGIGHNVSALESYRICGWEPPSVGVNGRILIQYAASPELGRQWIELPSNVWYKVVSEASKELQGKGHPNAGDSLFWDCGNKNPVWTSAHKMPNWAVRVTIEIENIRVTTFEGVSATDAISQGVYEITEGPDKGKWTMGHDKGHANPRLAFLLDWDAGLSRTSVYSWKNDPWLWIVDFKRVVTH